MLRTCIALTLVFMIAGATSAESPKHLFILSGQSNMGGLDPEQSFIPIVEKRFGRDKVIVVKDAAGGQSIRRWDKAWKRAGEDTPEQNGDLYDRLIGKVKEEIHKKEVASVTFLWMQGETDARLKHGALYARSLKRVYDQLSKDLKRDDINFVIGRLSDSDMENKRYGHWTMIRDVQVKVAEEHPRGAWVDTDDLNDGVNRAGKPIRNDLHYSAEGYKIFGERLAKKAIELIEKDGRDHS